MKWKQTPFENLNSKAVQLLNEGKLDINEYTASSKGEDFYISQGIDLKWHVSIHNKRSGDLVDDTGSQGLDSLQEAKEWCK